MQWNIDTPNYRKYQDFDDLYYSLLDEMINEGIQYQDASDGTVENLFITCDSFNCTLQPRDVLFKPITRWGYLCSRYVDYNDWVNFKSSLNGTKLPQSRTFRFKSGNGEILGEDVHRVKNGPCLLSMTISFNNNKPSSKYNRVDIVFRNSQVESKLVYDLILIHKMLTELSEFSSVEITRINFHMITAFVSCHYLAALMSLNDQPEKFLGDDMGFKPNESIIRFTKYCIENNFKDFYKVDPFRYQTARRFFKYYYIKGDLCPIKLNKFEKLKYDTVYKERNKFVDIDYNYLQLDGSYGKMIDVKTENITDVDKVVLW